MSDRQQALAWAEIGRGRLYRDLNVRGYTSDAMTRAFESQEYLCSQFLKIIYRNSEVRGNRELTAEDRRSEEDAIRAVLENRDKLINVLRTVKHDGIQRVIESNLNPTPSRNGESFTIQGYMFPPLGEWAHCPVLPREFFGLVPSDGDAYEVVGESRYQDGIRRVLREYDADLDPSHFSVMLIPEPLNPVNRNAVRVDLFYNEAVEKCGYLPRERAYQWHGLLLRNADQGFVTVMTAKVFGGTPQKPLYGVWLGQQPLNVSQDAVCIG